MIKKINKFYVVMLIIALLSVTVIAFIFSRPSYSFAKQNSYHYLVREISPDSAHYIIEKVITSSFIDPHYALVNSGYVIYDEDVVNITPGANYLIGGQIEIKRAPQITIVDGKKLRVVHSWVGTIADLFAEKAVPTIGKDDKIDKSMTDKIVHDMSVTIVRVQETDITEIKIIAYTTITKDDSTRYRGEPDVVKQTGKNGQKVFTYHVRREDGVEASRRLTKTDITASIDKIILYATKLKIGRVQNGNATWYKSKYQAASNTLRRGTNIRVSNPVNGKSVEIQIQDYMENDGSDDRKVIIDLNPDYFTRLGYSLGQGVAPVKVEEILN